MIKIIKNSKIDFALILALCSISILLFSISNDYGISWDEDWHRTSGKRVGVFLGQQIGLFSNLSTDYPNKTDYHGIIFDTICAFGEEIFGLQDSRKIYFMRHKLNVLFYLVGVVFFFYFSKYVFQKKSFAYIATSFYLVHPRLFANGFYNMKDSIVQVYVVIALFFLYKYLKTKKLSSLVFSGIFCGIATTTRIPIVYLAVYFSIFIYFSNYFSLEKKVFNNNKILKHIFIYNFVYLVSLLIFWPVLWKSPIIKFIEIFELTKSYVVDNNQFFMGDYVNSKDVPDIYLPVWILVTTPISFLVFFLVGIISFLRQSLNKINFKTISNAFNLFCFFTPLTAAIIFNSTLYDSWRQFHFIYPFMVMIIMSGFTFILSRLKLILNKEGLRPLLLLVFFTFSSPIYSLVKYHPNQFVYFNNFAGKDPMLNFDGDYWGLSYRQGLEYIAENDNRKKIKISVRNSPGRHNIKILDKKDRDRFEYVENIKESNYYLTNYRWKMKENYHLAKIDMHPVGKEYFSVNLGQMKILGVYKINLND
tara:strand:+ start:11254 stop:12852 length:1599 start_codon:yes stop_codon:yes gene_type:complete